MEVDALPKEEPLEEPVALEDVKICNDDMPPVENDSEEASSSSDQPPANTKTSTDGDGTNNETIQQEAAEVSDQSDKKEETKPADSVEKDTLEEEGSHAAAQNTVEKEDCDGASTEALEQDEPEVPEQSDENEEKDGENEEYEPVGKDSVEEKASPAVHVSEEEDSTENEGASASESDAKLEAPEQSDGENGSIEKDTVEDVSHAAAQSKAEEDATESEEGGSATTNNDDTSPSAVETDSKEDPPDSNGDTNGSEDTNDEDEFTSRAAIALAAVAVAANAQHSSPSAAAEAARALAPGIIPGAGMSVRKTKDVVVVNLEAVKKCLSPSNSPLIQKLADGENDAFLQHLLLLEYFRTDKESEQSVPKSGTKQTETESADESGVFDQEIVTMAAKRVRSLVQLIDGAYESMVGLLPPVPPRQVDESGEFDGIEAPSIVPDLLPPCTSTPGDATAEFFRECLGKCDDDEEEKDDAIQNTDSVDSETQQPPSPQDGPAGHSTATSVFSSMFSTVKRSSMTSPRASLTGVFRKRSRRQSAPERSASVKGLDDGLVEGEYSVLIEREMLGLTVENVLERTVVRTVLPGGAAKAAGARVGSLIVKVGNVETKNLTHFETIDELRQSQRPLRLVMRQISSEALGLAREEMGRLIRGAGFGTIIDSEASHDTNEETQQQQQQQQPIISRPTQIEIFSRVLHERWTSEDTPIPSKGEVPLDKAGEKLVWILTLIVYGLECEAIKQADAGIDDESPQEKQQKHHHTSKDYLDASRSISKVLLDYVKKKLFPAKPPQQEAPAPFPGPAKNTMIRRGRRGPPPPPPRGAPPGAGNTGNAVQALNSDKPLLRIGDVLHRTYTFLADPTSPPAALLRGEVIAFLCDVLDIDTGMELSEEENASSTAGQSAGPISDLGSAGSLLKLIILNCSMMRSPGCGTSSSLDGEEYLASEQRRRFGYKRQFSCLDAHRLHAGNRFLAVVHRLAASRSLSARVTACSLGPVLWGHLDFPHQLQLRGVVTRALHDVDVIVRKSTATVLHEVAELVFDQRAVPWLVLMCERAMTDPEPQLRSAAMTLTWHLAEHLPNAFLGDASEGSRSLRRLPPRTDPTFAEVYLLQCKLLPVATRLAEDRSPSVRLAVAAQCDRLCNALGDHWSSVIIDMLQALLGDTDERVRSEAILCVPRLVESVLSSSQRPADGGVGVLQALLPVSLKLQKDTCASVRVALATAAGELLTLLVGLESFEEMSCQYSGGEMSAVSEDSAGARRYQYKIYVDESLIPLVQQLLHDTDPEVTGSALRAVTNASRGTVREMRTRRNSAETEDDSISQSSIHSMRSITSAEKTEPVFIPVLSESQVLRLLPTLRDLSNSRQWRVRQGAVEIVPALLGCTNKLETRTEISRLCVHLMSDRVDAVRRTAAECLCLGGSSLGSHGEDVSGEWISSIVIPRIRACGESNDSKQRLLSLKMIEVMLLNGVCPQQTPSKTSSVHELLQVAISLSTDRVANVRLNVGRVIGNSIHMFDDTEVQFLISALEQQIQDEEANEDKRDRDVIYFAKRAIARARTSC